MKTLGDFDLTEGKGVLKVLGQRLSLEQPEEKVGLTSLKNSLVNLAPKKVVR